MDYLECIPVLLQQLPHRVEMMFDFYLQFASQEDHAALMRMYLQVQLDQILLAMENITLAHDESTF